MIYPTKKDAWIVIIVVGAGLLLLMQAAGLIISKGFSFPPTLIICGAVLFYFGIIFLLAYPINYEISGSTLEIRSGLLLRFTIPLSSITRVSPTNNPLSSPAWSLDRLQIDYLKNGKPKVIMVSPKDKDGFLRELRHKKEKETGPGLPN